ncbi:MAG: hypothetical protein U0V56_12475 [Actinomycetota bacterium]
MSIEADIAFFDDADEEKSDKVDGSIGELSRFHRDVRDLWAGESAWPRLFSLRAGGNGWWPSATRARHPAARSASILTTSSFRSWWREERRTTGSPAR